MPAEPPPHGRDAMHSLIRTKVRCATEWSRKSLFGGVRPGTEPHPQSARSQRGTHVPRVRKAGGTAERIENAHAKNSAWAALVFVQGNPPLAPIPLSKSRLAQPAAVLRLVESVSFAPATRLFRRSALAS